MIREAFKEELNEYLKQLGKESDSNKLLSRIEVAELLRISFPTLNNYKKSGILKYHRIGSRIIFEKGEVMEAL